MVLGYFLNSQGGDLPKSLLYLAMQAGHKRLSRGIHGESETLPESRRPQMGKNFICEALRLPIWAGVGFLSFFR